MKRLSHSGFTLVETMIVLVIVALVMGGIMVGREMIKASKLRAVLREWDGFRVAANQFRDKYFYFPGDLPTATSFWSAAYVVNGNGNGVVEATMSDCTECQQFFVHLDMTNLIDWEYTGWGTPSSLDGYPKSQMDAVFHAVRPISIYPTPDTGGDLLYHSGYHYNITTGTNNRPYSYPGYFFLPVDAKQLDKKIDDGKPYTGEVIAMPDPVALNDRRATSSCMTPWEKDVDYDTAGWEPRLQEYDISVSAGTDVGCTLVYMPDGPKNGKPSYLSLYGY